MRLKKEFKKNEVGWYLVINDDSIPLRELTIDYWKQRPSSYFICKSELCLGKLRIRYSKLPF